MPLEPVRYLRKDVIEDTSKTAKYERGRRTKVGSDKASYEAYNISSLTSSRPVLPTGCGFLGSNNGCQFTPYPVTAQPLP